MYKLGIDVGGTNTDSVLLDEKMNLIGSIKVPTSLDIHRGIQDSISGLLDQTQIDPKQIKYVMLGTTQCANAIVECKKLIKVCVIRLGYPATAAIEPFTEWPEPLKHAIQDQVFLLSGGFEFNGIPLSDFDEEKARGIIKNLKGKATAFAITSVFSCIKHEQELLLQEIIKQEIGSNAIVSLSHCIGSMGLIERENATILNAALNNVMQQCITGFKKAVKTNGIENANLYICQNDGTLMSLEFASQFPIFTVASGLTNSIRGASYLENRQNSIVIDVGGTTLDIGVIQSGYPRESSIAVEIGGIRTNFRMPDVISIGLGGGSIVKQINERIAIGPESLGHEITTKSLAFGGSILTTTDIAVRLGLADIGDKAKVAHLSEDFAKKVLEILFEKVIQLIDKMKSSSHDNAEVILVGGGSIIIPSEIGSQIKFCRPRYGSVANAIGAAIGKISGVHEQLYNLNEIDRTLAINEVTSLANERAISAGAEKHSLEIVEFDETHLAYHPGNTMKIKVKVVGNLLM